MLNNAMLRGSSSDLCFGLRDSAGIARGFSEYTIHGYGFRMCCMFHFMHACLPGIIYAHAFVIETNQYDIFGMN
jgi:hypothetical protein